MLSRRAFCTFAITAPAAALAHEGHDTSYLQARVTATQDTGQGLRLTLSLTNRGAAGVVLGAVYADCGPVTSPALPLQLPAGAEAGADLLIGADDWPGIFTIILDFGEAGVGPVTVIPA